MALYLGSTRSKVNLEGVLYRICSGAIVPINSLISSDDYILKDVDGLYLVVKHNGNIMVLNDSKLDMTILA